jgi:hypothetical protein
MVFSGFLGPLASFVVASLGHNCVPPPSFRGGIIGWPCLMKEFRLARTREQSVDEMRQWGLSRRQTLFLTEADGC